MHSTIRKVGGSVMLTLPPSVVRSLGVQPGDTLALSIENGRLVAASERPRYSLDELIAQEGRKARRHRDTDWIGGPSVGNEAI